MNYIYIIDEAITKRLSSNLVRVCVGISARIMSVSRAVGRFSTRGDS